MKVCSAEDMALTESDSLSAALLMLQAKQPATPDSRCTYLLASVFIMRAGKFGINSHLRY